MFLGSSKNYRFLSHQSILRDSKSGLFFDSRSYVLFAVGCLFKTYAYVNLYEDEFEHEFIISVENMTVNYILRCFNALAVVMSLYIQWTKTMYTIYSYGIKTRFIIIMNKILAFVFSLSRSKCKKQIYSVI